MKTLKILLKWQKIKKHQIWTQEKLKGYKNFKIDKMYIFKWRIGKAYRKVKGKFYYNDKNKKKRFGYCKKILNDNIDGKNIFFNYSPFVNEQIKLSKENKEKLKWRFRNV